MKAGYCVGKKLDNTLVYSEKYLMMEEFMEQENIEESSNVLIQQDTRVAKFIYDYYRINGFNHNKVLRSLMFENQTEIFNLLESGHVFSVETKSVEVKQEELFEEKLEKVLTVKKPEFNNTQKPNTYVSKKTKTLSVVNTSEIKTDRDKFLLAGKAFFTLKNEDNRNRVTYKVEVMKKTKYLERKFYFVSTLTGTDNYKNYSYIGMLKVEGNIREFYQTKKSKMDSSSKPVKGFAWLIKNLNSFPDNMKFYHEGKCARCGRKLTVPESIKSGFGPECIKLIN